MDFCARQGCVLLSTSTDHNIDRQLHFSRRNESLRDTGGNFMFWLCLNQQTFGPFLSTGISSARSSADKCSCVTSAIARTWRIATLCYIASALTLCSLIGPIASGPGTGTGPGQRTGRGETRLMGRAEWGPVGRSWCSDVAACAARGAECGVRRGSASAG